jgi:G3E family GTPase
LSHRFDNHDRKTETFSLDLFDSLAAYHQLRYADVILLNKCDLVDVRSLHAIESRIRETQESACISRIVQSDVALPLMLSVGLFETDRYYVDEPDHASDRRASDGFSCVSFASD